MIKQIPTEIYSRVCGFYRPTSQYNPGKKSEFNNRHEYTQEEIKQAMDKKNEVYQEF
jgi:ribonucleoside-triphosphate reductase (formate)